MCCLAHVPGCPRCIVHFVSEERPSDDIRARAESLVDAAEADLGGILSPVAREALTDAIRQDLHAAADSARVIEARIVKIETQTRF